jgi:hypothetical protein
MMKFIGRNMLTGLVAILRLRLQQRQHWAI